MESVPAEDVLTTVVRLLAEQQAMMKRLMERPESEKRVEGISMPHYAGQLNESLELFLDQARLFFEAKNIDYESPINQKRVLAMMVSNLRGQAAAWFTTQQKTISNITELATALRKEFIPADLQERLRDKLYALKQRECTDLADYITRYHQLISQVTQMSELDQITLFVRGLVARTREEVQYRRCSTVSEAVSVAMEYERTHASFSSSHARPRHQERRPYRERPYPRDGPEPMEIGNTRFLDRSECMRRNLCFRCKRPGHRMRDCRSGFGRQQGSKNESYSTSRDNAPRIHQSNFEETPRDPQIPNADDATEILFDHLTVSAATVTPASASGSSLVRKEGTVSLFGTPVTILLDSGADHNVIRPGLAKVVVRRKRVYIERFDGQTTEDVVNEVEADLCMEQYGFHRLLFTEYTLPRSHDVILGAPWFAKYNPDIDWVTHEVHVAEPDVDYGELKAFIDEFTSDDLGVTIDQLEAAFEGQSVEIVSSAKVEEQRPAVPAVSAGIAEVLKEFDDCAPHVLPNELPPHREVEFELTMKPDATPSSRAPFRLSRTEQEALDGFVQEMLERNWIKVSDSPWVSSSFAVPKKDPASGKQPSRSEWIKSGNAQHPVRWVVDYRYVNSQTEIPKIPLPRIEEIFDRMSGCTVFSTLDLAQGYHQMLVVPSSTKFTAFRTDKEVYQWRVAPMGLSGMPGVWSRLMRVLFGKFAFVVVYLDDLCVFSRSEEDHCRHLRAVFEVLRDGCNREVVQPTTVKELQSFLGLAGYYRKFICDFAELVLPLSDLVRKQVAWTWEAEQQQAFLQLKTALQQAPVLRLPDFSLRFILTTDASDTCCGGVLSQVFDGEDHPLAFFSKKLSATEQNWPAHEKELYTIKFGLAKWRHYLYGVEFDIFTDNVACKWFIHHPNVSPKMARWLDFFGQYNFVLHHIKGSTNVVADALSRPPASASDDWNSDAAAEPVSISALSTTPVSIHSCDDNCRQRSVSSRRHRRVVSTIQTLNTRDLDLLLDSPVPVATDPHVVGVPQRRLSRQINVVELNVSSVVLADQVKAQFIRGYRADPLYRSLATSRRLRSATLAMGEVVRHKELLYLKDAGSLLRLCVPEDHQLRTQLISQFHDSATSAHPGSRLTQLRLIQWYFWPTLLADVRNYVQSCRTCQQYKSSSLKKNGSLMPLPVPSEPWESVSIDFITGLPVSNGYDAIMNCVCRLSKRAKYTPTHSTATATETANLFFNAAVRHHGLPAEIISDRDSKFTSHFWQELMKLLGVKLGMTTAHRAQGDGQVERQNRIDTGRIPRAVGAMTLDADTRNDFAHNFVERRQEIVKRARANLREAQLRQKKYYDQKRSSVTFAVGDLVLLSTKNLPLAHTTRGAALDKAKLAPRYIGPYKITRMINDNVARLDLPRNMATLHNSFNIDLLKPFKESQPRFADRPVSKTTPVFVAEDGEPLYVIEKLVKRRVFNRKPEYLVKWVGLPEHENSWERERDIRHVSHWKQLLNQLRDDQRKNKEGRMSGSSRNLALAASRTDSEEQEAATASR